MRGSQFQSLSVTQAVIEEKRFLKHVSKVIEVEPKIKAEAQLQQSTKLFNEYSMKNHLRKTFQTSQLVKTHNTDNLRMLGTFNEIEQGKQLSVGRANYKENLTRNPVLDQHSLHCTSRKLELQEIDRKNQAIMKHIAHPNHTVRNKDLAKRWEKTQSFQNMISKANKKSGVMHLMDRNRYISKKELNTKRKNEITYHSVDSENANEAKNLYSSESRIDSLAQEKVLIQEKNVDIENPLQRIQNVQLPTDPKKKIIVNKNSIDSTSNLHKKSSTNLMIKSNLSSAKNEVLRKQLQNVGQSPQAIAKET